MRVGLILMTAVILMNDNHGEVLPVHVINHFQFLVNAPLSRAAPLFGPEAERCWAGKDWNPVFLHPQPGKDVPGAVFTVQHGSRTSVWINTLFEPAAGRMQYVSFVPETMVFTVDVRLTALDPSRTRVEVTYVRTAVNAAANDTVQAMGTSDRESGPEWERAIAGCLST